ncbi:ABC transporter permease subunit [Peribacillus sp. SCS-26]|uniref:ABC transporter permease subunit n=1 Tax=Paraperibacillus marinus TaxID=3115295 RepID=UPI003906BFBE
MKYAYVLLRFREASILFILALFILTIGLINPVFTSVDTLSMIMKSSMILLILAIGQSFVLITGNIDVSAGSVMGLSAAICGTLLSGGAGAGTAMLAAIAAAAFIGAVNGAGVVQFRIPAIIMTLGTMGIIRGCMLLYTEGKWIEDIPNSFKKLSSSEMMGLPVPVWAGILLLAAAHLFLAHTKGGRCFFAAGDNEAGARLIGLPVKRVKILAFIFSGASAGIAACIFVMNIGFVPNGTGTGIELQVIAASVLGGVSLSGGLGSLPGAALGAIFLEAINTSLVYLKIPAYWNNALSGALLLLIVAGDSRLQGYLRGKDQAALRKNKRREGP